MLDCGLLIEGVSLRSQVLSKGRLPDIGLICVRSEMDNFARHFDQDLLDKICNRDSIDEGLWGLLLLLNLARVLIAVEILALNRICQCGLTSVSVLLLFKS